MPQIVSSKVSLVIETPNSKRSYKGFDSGASEEDLIPFIEAVKSIQVESDKKPAKKTEIIYEI